MMQVTAAALLLAAMLVWFAQSFDWLALREWPRAGLMAGALALSACVYFGALAMTGLPLRKLLRR